MKESFVIIIAIMAIIGLGWLLSIALSKSPRFNPVDIERRLLTSQEYCAKGNATACDAVYENELRTK